MKKNILIASIAMLAAVNSAEAQIGNPYIHDPSTIMECEGKFYTFGTGGGGLISPDGYTWDSGAVRPGGGAAPDAIKIGDRYLIAYGATGGGLGGGHAGIIYTMWNKTLDPKSPDFKYSEPNLVAQSEYDEDCDAIDPSLLMGPDGRLWMSYALSNHRSLRLACIGLAMIPPPTRIVPYGIYRVSPVRHRLPELLIDAVLHCYLAVAVVELVRCGQQQCGQ